MIRSSAAIVLATAGESHAMHAPRGTIVTSTRIHIDEAISGPVHTGEDIDIVELGGFVGDRGLVIAGAPRFAAGERMLLLLERDSDASWTTKALALGRFTFTRDITGREILVRDENEILGFDTTGGPHREPRRDAAAFLRFVRETASGGNPPADYFVPRASLLKSTHAIETNAFAASTFTIQQNGIGMRWNRFPTPVTFQSFGTQPGALAGGLTAAQRGLSCWDTDPNSNIAYQYGGTTTSHGGFTSQDGVNSILFNDPNNEISGTYTGTNGDVLAIGGAWAGPATHTFNGETFYTITEADLVVQNGIFGAGLTGKGFDHVLAHELGHTLGFRHSDQDPTGTGPCDPNVMECSFGALMDSGVDFNNDTLGAALTTWDQDAASAVYGSAGPPPPPPCNPPSITTQPVSAAFTGSDVALTVGATGTATLSYQWYIGSAPDTRNPTGANSPSLIISSLKTTTNYWVRVTGACSPPADSNTATVTVNGCPAVVITSVSSDSTIIQNRSQTLSASASGSGRPLTYQWYSGAFGDTSHTAGTGAQITVAPQSTQTYWLLVTNDCGANATAGPITITVTPCNAPRIAIQPSNAEVVLGSQATFAVTIDGTTPMQMQWYEGARGDTSHPVTNATTSSFTTNALFAPTSFWLDATNACGEVQTVSAAVTIVPNCTAPVISLEPADTSVAPGTAALLTVVVSGPSLTYAWYQGQVLDFTHPVGRSSPSLETPAITTVTQFWVRITNPCGAANSVAATVNPSAGVRRRAVKP